jgi:hypothetical protein
LVVTTDLLIVNKQKYYFPIVFLLSWLIFTILVFAYGPYEYKVTRPAIFYSYLVAIHLALLLGYLRGQRSTGRGFQIRIDYYRFVRVTIIISFFYLIIKLLLTFGGDLNNIKQTFTNARKAYLTSSIRHSNLFSYLDIFFAPITLIAVTNAIFSYKHLRRRYKFILFVLILFSIAAAIGSATRSGIVQVAIIGLSAFLLGIYKQNYVLKQSHKILILVFTILIAIGFLTYSSLLTNSRGGRIYVNPLTNEAPRKDFFLTKNTSPKFHHLINNVSFYVSHSYFRLNKAMNLPFKGLGFGLSNSFFIMDNIEQLTGCSYFKEVSYGLRLDKDIGSGYGLYWSTFYTWIASDFTFPGTVIVIFFIGYLLSLSMKDSVSYLNPLAVTVYCTLFYNIFHFAFNNPLQDGAGLTTGLVVPAIWLIFRKIKKAETPSEA